MAEINATAASFPGANEIKGKEILHIMILCVVFFGSFMVIVVGMGLSRLNLPFAGNEGEVKIVGVMHY